MKYLLSCLTLLQIAKVSCSDFDFYFRQDRSPENTLEEIIQENNDRRFMQLLIFVYLFCLFVVLGITLEAICNKSFFDL